MRLAGYQHIPGKLRLPSTSQNTPVNPFDCALGGPFDNLFLT